MVMPRTRPYSRKELETLRRADLQNLYKIHGLKGANQKSDALIDSLEDFFTSNTGAGAGIKTARPASPAKHVRPAVSVSVPVHPSGAGVSRQLKPIPGQGSGAREVQSRPGIRRSPVKAGRPGMRTGTGTVVSAETATTVGGVADKAGRVDRTQNASAVSKSNSLPAGLPTKDSLAQRVTSLSSRIDDIDSQLSLGRLETIISDIASLKDAVSRLDTEVAALTFGNGTSGSSRDVNVVRAGTALNGQEEDAVEKRIKAVDEAWRLRLEEMDAKWEERFQRLEERLGGNSTASADISRRPDDQGSPQADERDMDRGRAVSITALGKRRERDPDSDLEFNDSINLEHGTGSGIAQLGSPTKRARIDHTHSLSLPIIDQPESTSAALSRNPSSSKPPRTPSPSSSPRQNPGVGAAVFKTPDLPASAMKLLRPLPLLSLPLPEPSLTASVSSNITPRTPSPGHQGTLPDNSATPRFVSDSNYFAGLPGVHTPQSQNRSSLVLDDTDGQLPFPLFATTPRPVAPTSPTTDAPPSTIRRKRADTTAALGVEHFMLTPGPVPILNKEMRPTRTVSQAHKELSSVTDGSAHADPQLPGSIPVPAIPRSTRKTSKPPISVPSTAQRLMFPPISSSSASTEMEQTFIPPPPLLGPELTKEIGTPPARLSPSPSITESRFSAIPFPSKNQSRSTSASTLGTSTTLATELNASEVGMSSNDIQLRSSSPADQGFLRSDEAVQQKSAGKTVHVAAVQQPSTPTKTSTSTTSSSILGSSPTDAGDGDVESGLGLGLGMMTPGHRTMLGTESYRDTRFGDQPVAVAMGWGTPEMPETPRAGGSAPNRGGPSRAQFS